MMHKLVASTSAGGGGCRRSPKGERDLKPEGERDGDGVWPYCKEAEL